MKKCDNSYMNKLRREIYIDIRRKNKDMSKKEIDELVEEKIARLNTINEKKKYEKMYRKRVNKDSLQSKYRYKNNAKIDDTVPDFDLNDPVTKFITKQNGIIENIITSKFETSKPFVYSVALDIHSWLSDTSDIYSYTSDAISGTWKNSEQIQAIKEYIYSNKNLETIMHQLGAANLNSNRKMIRIMTELTKTFELELGNSKFGNDEYIDKVNDVFAKGGISEVYSSGTLKELVDKKSNIYDEINRVENEIKQLGGDIDISNRLSDLFLDNPQNGVTKANLEAYGFIRGTKLYKKMDELIGLYSLSKIDGSVDMLVDMYKNNRYLFDKFLQTLTSVKALDDSIHEVEHGDYKIKDKNRSRGNMVDDLSIKNIVIVPIEKKDLNTKMFNDDTWTIIRNPTDKDIGLAYRTTNEKMQEGIGNVNYMKTGIRVNKDMLSKYDIDELQLMSAPINNETVEESYALVLTKDEKDKIGYINNPASLLLRSYAHKMRIKETQGIRDAISDGLSKEYVSIDDLNDDVSYLIEKDEHPVYLSVGNNFDFSKLDKQVKMKYRLVDRTLLSDVGDFNNRFDLVRKDVAQKIEGFREDGLFKSHQLNRYLDNLKDFVRWGKQGLIILNPVKIAGDLAVGITLASAKGSSVQEIFKYSNEATEGTKRITGLLNKQIDIEFRYNMYKAIENPTAQEKSILVKLKSQLKSINHRIETDVFYPALEGGFLQSLGTDILSKDKDTVYGLQSKMEDMISKLTKNNKDELTGFNNAVRYIARFGGEKFNVGTLYDLLADRIDKDESSEGAAKILREMSSDLEKIRNSEDMTRYVAEILASPNSTLVRLGGAFTIMADIIPRWIMYRHNINIGMGKQDAINDTLNALPNYMFGMPSSLSFASDLYITPFPSFYTRFQRTILTLMHKSLASVMSQLAVSEVLESAIDYHTQTIFGGNILNKIDNGSLLSSPTELPLFPYSHIIP